MTRILPWTTSQERILKEYVNTKFKEVRINNSYSVKESTRIDKSKYFHFHKIHKYNTNNCIQLKDAIEGLINKRPMFEYSKDGKMDRDIFSKRKQSTKKIVEFMVEGKCK